MGRLQGDEGRAEDPFRPTKGRTELAEAGPPGKRPHGNESARSSLQHFIFKAAIQLRNYQHTRGTYEINSLSVQSQKIFIEKVFSDWNRQVLNQLQWGSYNRIGNYKRRFSLLLNTEKDTERGHKTWQTNLQNGWRTKNGRMFCLCTGL
jgi:hypothetical protein